MTKITTTAPIIIAMLETGSHSSFSLLSMSKPDEIKSGRLNATSGGAVNGDNSPPGADRNQALGLPCAPFTARKPNSAVDRRPAGCDVTGAADQGIRVGSNILT